MASYSCNKREEEREAVVMALLEGDEGRRKKRGGARLKASEHTNGAVFFICPSLPFLSLSC